MTQTQRTPTPWLVTLPASDTSRVTHTAFIPACRGHEKMAEVLGYFVYEASWQAKNAGIDISSLECQCIEVRREQVHMLARIPVCQKSLIAYIKELEVWGFLKVDGYRHTYTVYFRKINEALAHPPEADAKKPRGKHAPKREGYADPERATKIQSQLVHLQSRLVKIQSQTVKIQSRIVNLQNEMVKIQSSQSCKDAPEQGITADLEAPRIYRITKDLKESLIVATVPSSLSADADEGGSSEDQEETHEQESMGEGVQAGLWGVTGEFPALLPVETPTPESLQPALPNALGETPMPEQAPVPASSNETQEKADCKITVFPGKPPGKTRKPEPVVLCQPRVIRELLDANRGHGLEERGAIIHQNIVLKDWCKVHPLAHYHLVLDHLKSCRCKNPVHQWWHKEEHWRFLSAEKLAELTPGVLSELGKIPKPAPPEEARAAPVAAVAREWQPAWVPCPRGR